MVYERELHKYALYAIWGFTTPSQKTKMKTMEFHIGKLVSGANTIVKTIYLRWLWEP